MEGERRRQERKTYCSAQEVLILGVGASNIRKGSAPLPGSGTFLFLLLFAPKAAVTYGERAIFSFILLSAAGTPLFCGAHSLSGLHVVCSAIHLNVTCHPLGWQAENTQTWRMSQVVIKHGTTRAVGPTSCNSAAHTSQTARQRETAPPQKKRHGHSIAYPHCLIMVGESLCVRVWQMRACERRQIPESSRKMRLLDDAYFSSAIHCDAAVEEMRAAEKQKQSKQQQCGVRELCGATHGSTGRGLAGAERKKSDKETRKKRMLHACRHADL
jgi:hypothetical protein